MSGHGDLEEELRRLRDRLEILEGGIFQRLTIRDGLYIRDEGGTLRGALMVVDDQVGLIMMNRDGEAVASLTPAGLTLFTPDGRHRAKILLSDDDFTPSVILADANGKPRASMSVMADGARFMLHDANGGPVIELTTFPEPSINVKR